MFEEELKKLSKEFPIPPDWSSPELFQESLEIAGATSLNLLGLASTYTDGTTVYGSAADVGGGDLKRAYFELLERTTLVRAMRSNEPAFLCVDSVGRAESEMLRSEVFPQSPEPDKWIYSASNAVAAHATLPEACRAAEAELVERDCLLSAWYGVTRPERLELRIPCGLDWLHATHDIIMVRFADRWDSNWQTVGIFGFPFDDKTVRFMGFGTAETVEQAIHKAERESLQNFGFLNDSGELELPVPFRPTADYHQEVFMTSDGISKLRNWVEGKRSHDLLQHPTEKLGKIRFAIISPSNSTNVVVVKAVQPGRFPLYFGACPLYAGSATQIHPIA